ncbi:MAG: hypothetical protein PWQ57_955 [Desulfovibrionales bacterium]|jgi:hypothetical protein|nr:hypothetical protein [Desulfovibrionales bacterium]
MSFDFISKIAEEKILDSMNRGEFQNLEGQGRPIVYEDDSMIPEDLRMAYKILKNSGHTPPEIEQEKEIRSAIDLLEHFEDEKEKYKQIQKVNYMITQLNLKYNRPIPFEKEEVYYDKLVERVHVRSSEKK